MEKLRAYISIVKEKFQPVINDAAALLLEHHYEKVRSAQSSVIPVTVRFLESLIRLTQAHARLMYRNVATLEDAVAVIRVMECSAYAYGGFDGNVNDIDNVMYRDPMSMDSCDLPPDDDFCLFEHRLLKNYNMLEYMPQERRERAIKLEGSYNDEPVNGTAVLVAPGGNWQGVEATRDILHDHYGRSYFSPTTSTSGEKRRRLYRQ